jgi:hypothetical protein
MAYVPRPLKWPPIFPLQKGLVAWYPFDDRSGAVLRDRSGKGNHGTLVGPTWGASRRGPALNFNGTSDYGNVSDVANLRVYGDLTILAWIKLVDYLTYYMIITKMVDASARNTFELRIDSTTGQLRFVHADDDNYEGFSSNTAVPTNSWAHVGVVRKALTSVTLYLNGVSDGSGVPGRTPTGLGDLKIGVRLTSYWFKGQMADIRLYNQALNAAEIKRLYESELMLARH